MATSWERTLIVWRTSWTNTAAPRQFARLWQRPRYSHPASPTMFRQVRLKEVKYLTSVSFLTSKESDQREALQSQSQSQYLIFIRSGSVWWTRPCRTVVCNYLFLLLLVKTMNNIISRQVGRPMLFTNQVSLYGGPTNIHRSYSTQDKECVCYVCQWI